MFSASVVKGSDYEYRLHTFVLCRNRFFAGAFNASSVFIEAQGSSINMEADGPCTPKAFLIHLYGYIFPESSDGGGHLVRLIYRHPRGTRLFGLTDYNWGIAEVIKVYTIAGKYGETYMKPLVCGRISNFYEELDYLGVQEFAAHVIQTYEVTVQSG